jgi:hypothetical protein
VSWSTLVWSDLPDTSIERHAAVLTSEWQLGERHTLQVGWGAVPRGHLFVGTERHDIAPGWLGLAAFSWRIAAGEGPWPFVLTSLSFAGSSARTVGPDGTSARLVAIDLRGGVTVGKTLWDTLSPYAALRLFGGPVLWEYRGASVGGSDRHHVQAAVGGVLTLAPVDVYVEWAFAGERALGGGIGVSF